MDFQLTEDQRAVEDAMADHPLFIVNGRIVGIAIGNSLQRLEGGFDRS